MNRGAPSPHLSPPARERVPEGPDPITIYHVNARLSTGLEDVGQPQLGKLWLVGKYCLEAIWCRIRYGADVFYYVPAPPARTPIYRDWLVMTLCRPFFRQIVFHWHAGGLGEWLATEAKPWERRVTRALLGHPDLSLVLRPYNRMDAERLESQHIEVVPDGIPDPCPEFDKEVLAHRLARVAARRQLLKGQELPSATRTQAGENPERFRVLYLSLCHPEKGLFDAIAGVEAANRLVAGGPVHFELTVAGAFASAAVRQEFEARCRTAERTQSPSFIRYAGFVSGEAKRQLWLTSDCLCFPTCMPEGFGLVLVESLAYGLPVITTRERDLPEILPPGFRGTVEAHAPAQIADRLVELLETDYDPGLRAHFLAHYTAAQYGRRLKEALLGLASNRSPI